jgi:hypothetical protein
MNTVNSFPFAEIIPVLAIGGGLLIAALAIVSCTIRGMARRRNIEESRRELAAYVAEGSMTAQDAKDLLDAGPKQG